MIAPLPATCFVLPNSVSNVHIHIHIASSQQQQQQQQQHGRWVFKKSRLSTTASTTASASATTTTTASATTTLFSSPDNRNDNNDAQIRARARAQDQDQDQDQEQNLAQNLLSPPPPPPSQNNQPFDLTTALFCGGLAFDAYAEPPINSSRWERGPSGCNVAFQSPAFTRSIYKALLQIQPIKCTDLPDEDDTAEGIMTGSGTDAYLLVAVAEGKWKEDVKYIENEKFNDGVLALQGCAHVGRSSTAWSNIDEKKAKADLKRGKGNGVFHIKSSWGKGGQAVWEADDPFYLYVQDPSDARLVFTVMDDDIVGNGEPIGSTSRKLVDVLSSAKVDDPISLVKDEVMKRIKRGEEVDLNDTEELLKSIAQEWKGDMKLTSKPRKKDKNSQIAGAMAAGAMVAGPAGAAVGGIIGSLYEGEVRTLCLCDVIIIIIIIIIIPIPTFAVCNFWKPSFSISTHDFVMLVSPFCFLGSRKNLCQCKIHANSKCTNDERNIQSKGWTARGRLGRIV